MDAGQQHAIDVQQRLHTRRRLFREQRPLRLGETQVVIGVMPASFRYPSRTTELWVPLAISPQRYAERGSHWLMGLARLKPGVTLEQANEQMNIIANRLLGLPRG